MFSASAASSDSLTLHGLGYAASPTARRGSALCHHYFKLCVPRWGAAAASAARTAVFTLETSAFTLESVWGLFYTIHISNMVNLLSSFLNIWNTSLRITVFLLILSCMSVLDQFWLTDQSTEFSLHVGCIFQLHSMLVNCFIKFRAVWSLSWWVLDIFAFLYSLRIHSFGCVGSSLRHLGSSRGTWALSAVVVRGLQRTRASAGAALVLSSRGIGSGAHVGLTAAAGRYLLCGLRVLSALTRDWTHVPAWQGRFLTTGPPGKSPL